MYLLARCIAYFFDGREFFEGVSCMRSDHEGC
jgi:hypothetical protein